MTRNELREALTLHSRDQSAPFPHDECFVVIGNFLQSRGDNYTHDNIRDIISVFWEVLTTRHDPSKGNPTNLMLGVAINFMRNVWRAERRMNQLKFVENVPDTTSVAPSEQGAGEDAFVADLLESVDEELYGIHRDRFLLALTMSAREVAREVGLKPGQGTRIVRDGLRRSYSALSPSMAMKGWAL